MRAICYPVLLHCYIVEKYMMPCPVHVWITLACTMHLPKVCAGSTFPDVALALVPRSQTWRAAGPLQIGCLQQTPDMSRNTSACRNEAANRHAGSARADISSMPSELTQLRRSHARQAVGAFKLFNPVPAIVALARVHGLLQDDLQQRELHFVPVVQPRRYLGGLLMRSCGGGPGPDRVQISGRQPRPS